jgi:hypothetical protein
MISFVQFVTRKLEMFINVLHVKDMFMYSVATQLMEKRKDMDKVLLVQIVLAKQVSCKHIVMIQTPGWFLGLLFPNN